MVHISGIDHIIYTHVIPPRRHKYTHKAQKQTMALSPHASKVPTVTGVTILLTVVIFDASKPQSS